MNYIVQFIKLSYGIYKQFFFSFQNGFQNNYSKKKRVVNSDYFFHPFHSNKELDFCKIYLSKYDHLRQNPVFKSGYLRIIFECPKTSNFWPNFMQKEIMTWRENTITRTLTDKNGINIKKIYIEIASRHVSITIQQFHTPIILQADEIDKYILPRIFSP